MARGCAWGAVEVGPLRGSLGACTQATYWSIVYGAGEAVLWRVYTSHLLVDC